MYNRYVRNDNGVYQRVPVVQATHSQGRETKEETGVGSRAACDNHSVSEGDRPGKEGLFSGILGKLKLDEIDTGDLLLLVLLFLLFRDGGDEELLIALGLLLIL